MRGFATMSPRRSGVALRLTVSMLASDSTINPDDESSCEVPRSGLDLFQSHLSLFKKPTNYDNRTSAGFPSWARA